MTMLVLFVFALVSIMIGSDKGSDQNNAVCPIADKWNPLTMIIVGMGLVGTAMAEHFRKLGLLVIGVDPKPFDKLSEVARTFRIYPPDQLPELAKTVDIINVAPPICELAKVINILAPVMKPGSLVISNGSVANPTAPNDFCTKLLTDKGINFAHFHPMYRTVLPLSETLYGENNCLTIEGQDAIKWQAWAKGKFEPYGAIIHDLKPKKHDKMTISAQLCHMMATVGISEVWCETPENELNLGLKVGGYPAQAMIRSVVRSQKGSAVIGQILTSHPDALATITHFRSALDKIENAIVSGDSTEIEGLLKTAYARVDEDTRTSIEESIEDHMQFDADCRKPNAKVKFTADENVIGLIGKVIAELDSFRVDKTSTYARNFPDGGCKFIFGVRTSEEKDLADRLIDKIKQEVDFTK